MKKFTKRFLFALGVAGASAGAYALVHHQDELRREEASLLWNTLGLRPGLRVGEIGAGGGELAAMLSSRLGKAGRVFASELDAKKERKLSRIRDREGWKNVLVTSSSPEDCNLPEESCDAIYMRGVYHHFTDPAKMNRSILAALRPGGNLAIIDFAPRLLLAPWTPKGIPENRGGHGIRPNLVVEEVTKAGFDHVRTIEQWPGSKYCVVFQRPIPEGSSDSQVGQ